MRLVPLSEHELELIARAIDAQLAAIEDEMIDEPSAAAVERWREDIDELLALRRRIAGKG